MIQCIPKHSPTQGLQILSLKELCAIKILSHGLEEKLSTEQKEFFSHQVFSKLWADLKSNTPPDVLMLKSRMSKIEGSWEDKVKREEEKNIFDELDLEFPNFEFLDGFEYESIEELLPKTSKELLPKTSKEFELFRSLACEMIGLFKKAELITPILNNRIPVSCIEYTHMQEILKKDWEDETLLRLWEMSIREVVDDNGAETADDIKRFIADPANALSLREVTFIKLKDYNLQAVPPEMGYFTELKVVKLQENGIANIEHLGKLINLEWLDLGANNISNIAALANCTALKTLILETNQITNIDSLKNLTNLKCLDLGMNRITTLNPISQCTKLKVLLASENLISSVAPLCRLRNLEDLQLWDNPLLISTLPKMKQGADDEWIEWYKYFTDYECTSQYSKFLKLILMVTQDTQTINEEFQKLKHDDRCLIDSMVCKLRGKVLEGPDQKKTQTFLPPKILYADMNLFSKAGTDAVMEKFEQLTFKEKNKVCLEVYHIAHLSPDIWENPDDRVEQREETDKIQSGKKKLLDNIFRAADAMANMGYLDHGM